MRPYAFCLLLVLLIFGCKKEHQPSAPVNNRPATTGSIAGTISPAGAAATVYAVSADLPNATPSSVIPDNNGNFQFSQLPPGNYALSYQTNSAYIAPAQLKILVVAGQTFTTGPIVFQKITYGSFTGTVTPASAVVKIQAYNSLSGAFTSVPDASGNFKFDHIPTGNYSLSFTVAGQYFPPPASSITVTDSQVIDAGQFNFTPYAKAQSITFTDNESPRSFTGGAAYVNGRLTLQANGSQGSPGIDDPVSYASFQLTIDLPGVSGPGTYSCDANSAGVVTYSRSAAGPGGAVSWNSHSIGANVTVVIQSIDPASATIRGSFSGTLTGTSIITQKAITMMITNGNFVTSYR